MTRRLGTLLALGALFTLGLAATAQAGTYTVSQCDARTSAALHGWSFVEGGSWKTNDRCPASVLLSSSTGTGYAAIRTPNLPGELGITRVSFLAQGLRTPGARPEAGFCLSSPAKALCKRQNTRRVAKSSGKAHTVEYVWHPRGKKTAAKAFEVALRSTRAAAAKSAYLKLRHFRFTVSDDVAPTIAVDSSSIPAVAANTTFDVTVSGTDQGGGVAGFWMQATGAADAAASRHLSAECNNAKWQPCAGSTSRTFTINTADFENGPATLTFTSEDAAGNRSTPVTIAFTVSRKITGVVADTTAPVLNVDSAGLPSSWVRGDVVVQVSATDGESGVRGFWLDASTDNYSAATQFRPGGCDPAETPHCPSEAFQSFTIPTTNFGSGTLTFTILAEDDAGNGSAPQTFSIDVDNTPPPRPGLITWGGSHCYAVSPSWPAVTDDTNGSPITGLRVTYARFNHSWTEETGDVYTVGNDVVLNIPLGTTDDYGEVTTSSIESLRLPAGMSSQENTYLVSIALVDQAGNVGAPRTTSIDAWSCDS